MENLEEFEKMKDDLSNMAEYVPFEDFTEGDESLILTENGLIEVENDGE